MQNLFEKLIVTMFKISLFSICSFLVFYFSFQQWQAWEIYKNTPAAPFVDDGVCNVVTIPVAGAIGIAATSAYANDAGQTISTIPSTGDIDRIIYDLEYVKRVNGINAVILQIDSYGGYGNSGIVLLDYLKSYPLPVVSLIRDAGDSMGYMVALGGKKIFAYPGADVGSIGVDSSLSSVVDKNEKEGIEYISIVSGKYKDVGKPEKELSESDLAFLKKSNQKYFDLFVNTVAEKRNMKVEDVLALSDGRSWIASEAKSLGLIDEVGGQESVLRWIESYWAENSTVDMSSGQTENVVALPCSQY